jgi:hypothetical protein
MLINNEFVFLAVPRNATSSMYRSLRTWNIPINWCPEIMNFELKYNLITNDDTKHYHFTYNTLIKFFPNKPFITLYRDPTDRFISGIYYFFDCLFKNKPKSLMHDFLKFNTNDYINFFKNLIIELNNYVKEGNNIGLNPFFHKYFTNTKFNINEYYELRTILSIFLSQYYYGTQHCDEIIPIENIKLLEQRIQIIKPNFNLIKVNEKNLNLHLNIKKTDKLEEFVYEFIDKPFIKIEKKEKTFL